MDAAHEWTDRRLAALEKKISSVYETAAEEMRAKQKKAMEKYSRERSERLKALDDTPEAKEAYDAWLGEQSVRSDYLNAMVGQLSKDATMASEKAIATVNDYLPGIYSENANWSAYDVDRKVGLDTAFTLVDEDTVRNLLANDPKLYPTPSLDIPKSMRWNMQHFSSAVTQGILQGESVQDIAKRLTSVVGMNANSAIRAARTATTGAENAGRKSSYKRASELGVKVKKQWMATLDLRTRATHRELDGQKVDIDKPFKVGGNEIDFPGDPEAEPAEVYNCRCTLVGAVDGVDDSKMERWSELPEGMTYEEWKAGKDLQGTASEQASGIVDGKDILGTWKRRPDKFDFEIEDVMAAQGFDGKPRILDADEFDRAVKQANNGDGFIAQRIYAAPDKTTLDSYREQLYDGKWYVDCSQGAATYGQGMYGAASLDGVVADDVTRQIDFYKNLYGGNGKAESYTETFTLDRTARTVPYNELRDMQRGYSVGAEEFRASEKAAHQQMWKDGKITAQEGMELDRETDDKYWKMRDAESEARSMNSSSFAAALGYDAVIVEEHGVTEVIVLNRTKLIIRRPE